MLDAFVARLEKREQQQFQKRKDAVLAICGFSANFFISRQEQLRMDLKFYRAILRLKVVCFLVAFPILAGPFFLEELEPWGITVLAICGVFNFMALVFKLPTLLKSYRNAKDGFLDYELR